MTVICCSGLHAEEATDSKRTLSPSPQNFADVPTSTQYSSVSCLALTAKLSWERLTALLVKRSTRSKVK